MQHQHWIRCASTKQIDFPFFHRSAVGRRAFPVAEAKVWNSLPGDVTSASSLPVFKNRLENLLRSYSAAAMTFSDNSQTLLFRTSVGLRNIVMSMSVCLSVCVYLSTHITREPHGQTSHITNFYECCLWSWFVPPLTVMLCTSGLRLQFISTLLLLKIKAHSCWTQRSHCN